MIIGGKKTMHTYYLVIASDESHNIFSNRSGTANRIRKRNHPEIPKNFRILLVDDDKDFNDALSFRLRKKEIDVIAVESGYDAVKAVRKNGFDLILLDLKMPGMDGIETFKKINEIKNRHFIVLMTAFHEKEQKADVKELGAFGLLRKPFEFDQLLPYIIKTKEGKNENGKNSYH